MNSGVRSVADVGFAVIYRWRLAPGKEGQFDIVFLAAIHANLEPGSRSRILRESGLPFLPVEMASGVLAASG